MGKQRLILKTITETSNGKFYNEVGAMFAEVDEHGNITSAALKHCMFPGVNMVAFPPSAGKSQGDGCDIVDGEDADS